MLVLILLTDIDPHLLQEESKTCPRDSMSDVRCQVSDTNLLLCRLCLHVGTGARLCRFACRRTVCTFILIHLHCHVVVFAILERDV